MTVRRVSAYKAAANETHDSRKAVRVTEDFTSSVAGTQPTPNGPAKIEGTGTGSGAYYVGNDGRYRPILGARVGAQDLRVVRAATASDHHRSEDQGQYSQVSREWT